MVDIQKLEEKMKRRVAARRKSSYGKIIEAKGCEQTGGGVILVEESRFRSSQTKAYFYRAAQTRQCFAEKVITTAHERISLMETLRDMLSAEKAEKVAPHNLKVGDIICFLSGVTMQSAEFRRVVGIPHPRKVSLAPLNTRVVTGDWMAGTVEPVIPTEPCSAAEGVTYDVQMVNGEPSIKTGCSITRTQLWNGKPASIWCD